MDCTAVTGGVVVYDLRTKLIKWTQHLDLTTDSTTYKAHIFAPPTLVDLDGDGRLEIVIGTSVGFVYVLDSAGNPRQGWPVQMGEVQGQVLVADLNGDGQMEIFAGKLLLWGGLCSAPRHVLVFLGRGRLP